MTDDVVRAAGAHRNVAHGRGEIGAALGPCEELRQYPGPLAAGAACNIPHGARARRVGRAAIADLVDVEAVRPGEEFEQLGGDRDLVTLLRERDDAAHRSAVLRR